MNLSKRLTDIVNSNHRSDDIKKIKSLLDIKRNLLLLIKLSSKQSDRAELVDKIIDTDCKIDDLASTIENNSCMRYFETDFEYKRGQIVMLNLGTLNKIGSEQKGLRPCVIVQNNSGNKFSPSLIVCPITAKIKKELPTHVFIYKDNYEALNHDCTILCEQILTVSKDRCYKIIGQLNYNDMAKLDECLRISVLS